MRITHRRLVLVLIAAVAVATQPACSTVRIDAADDLDLSPHRTWGWGVPDKAVDPESVSADDLEMARRLAHQIQLVMNERGFVYAGAEADLLVIPDLRIRQRRSVVHNAVADQFLPSHHDTPSYQIERLTAPSIEVIEVSDLVIEVVDRRSGQTVWRGRFLASFEHSFAPHLDTSVARLMDPFPNARRDPLQAPVERNIAQTATE